MAAENKLLLEYQINMLRQEFSDLEDKHIRNVREVLAMKNEIELLKDKNHRLEIEQTQQKRLLEPFRNLGWLFSMSVVAAKAIAAFGLAGGTLGLVWRLVNGGGGQ